MTTLEMVLEQIKQLSPEDRQKVRQAIDEEEQKTMTLYRLSGDDLQTIDDAFQPLREALSEFTEEEIDQLIDESIQEVRHASKANRRI